MADPAANSRRSPDRRSRRVRPPAVDPGSAHDFVTNLFATLTTLRESLAGIYSPAGLNEHKFAVLTTLAAQAPTPSLATRLARSAHITRASMTEVLDDLQRRRWIERRRDLADRRVILIHLTPLGQEVVDTTNAHFEAICRALLGDVPPRELARFAKLCALLGRASHTLAASAPPFRLPLCAG